MKKTVKTFTDHLLLRKQLRYLYRTTPSILASIFIGTTLVFLVFWPLSEIREQLSYWYAFSSFIILLRILLFFYYGRSPAARKPFLWINFYVSMSCIHGLILSMAIYFVPLDRQIYYTYVVILIGIIPLVTITSLGVLKRLYFIYIFVFSIPSCIYFFNHLDVDIMYLIAFSYLIICFMSSGAVIRFNNSLTAAFVLQIQNKTLTNKINQEIKERISVEKDLHEASLNLQSLNDNLEHKIKEKTDELENMAFYDTLTQLPNRHHFYDYLNRIMGKSKDNIIPFALIFIDLDEFKTINDTLGHHYGDELLKKVAHRLHHCTRNNDFIARIGGDEFIVVIKSSKCVNCADAIARKIIKKISEPYDLANSETFISCSLGIALYPQDGKDINTLVKYSDLAMYHAKENGKNSYCYYNNALYEEKTKRFILSNALKSAVQNNELSLLYQPKVSCQNEDTKSMEVLLRWNSQEFGCISPSEFIPLAEESNQIIELENFVLQTAFKQVKSWNKKLENDFSIAINISAIHFAQRNFVQNIEDILLQEKFAPEWLELELTESALMSHTIEDVDKLTYLKSLGVKISIDDFGTGYSSLSYLKQLPIDFLKIDKSFIDGIPTDSNDNMITKAIVDLAHQFKLETIAEGVESKEQVNFLKQIGCTLIQGYYYYRPLTTSDFEKEFGIT